MGVSEYLQDCWGVYEASITSPSTMYDKNTDSTHSYRLYSNWLECENNVIGENNK